MQITIYYNICLDVNYVTNNLPTDSIYIRWYK